MEIVQVHIQIGDFTFDFVHQITFESSWNNLTDQGSIKLPSKLKFDRGNLKTEIKKGAQIVIKSGYKGNLNDVFTGYVTRVIPSVPVEIMFENEMWKLKQMQVNDTAKNETIKSFLTRNIQGYEIDCYDITLPKFIAFKITAAQLLDQLKQDFGFAVFFRGKRLVVGKQYDAEKYKIHRIELNYNVVQDSLEYVSKEDVKVKVTGISNMADGSKHEVEIGDPDGESRSLNFYNIPKADLKKLVEKEAEKFMFDGYRGSITIFGLPFVQHGDLVELENKEQSDKTGRYWVDAIEPYEHGLMGVRQTIKLGMRYE